MRHIFIEIDILKKQELSINLLIDVYLPCIAMSSNFTNFRISINKLILNPAWSHTKLLDHGCMRGLSERCGWVMPVLLKLIFENRVQH